MRVLIPKGGAWGDEVAGLVTEAGLEPLVLPLTTLEPAEDQERLALVMGQLAEGRFDWLVVTSQSTVRYLPRVPASVSVAAVGNVTAAALRAHGIPVAFVPSVQSAAGLVDEWPIPAGRVVWPRALDAKPTIKEGLTRRGMHVTDVVAYRSMPLYESPDELVEAVDESDVLPAAEPVETPVDAVLVTSGSVAKQVVQLGLDASTVVVAIGQQTAEDCARAGLEVAGIAATPTPAGLVAELVRVRAEPAAP